MLVVKSENLKQSIDEFWLMRTPERVENLPSPPTWPTKQKMTWIKEIKQNNH